MSTTQSVQIKRSKTQTALLASGLGGIVFVLTYLVLGGLAPGYDSRRASISALEFTAYGTVQRINFLAFGVALCLFAIALRRELRAGRGAVLIPAVQILCGVGVIGDAVFIYEPMHLVCDLIAFNAALLVLFLFAWRFADDSRWRGWTSFSILTAILMMAFLTAFGFALHNGGPAGLFEKLASVTRSSWSVLLVFRLFGGRLIDKT